MKLDACWKKVNSWTVLPGRVGLIAALHQSGRRSSRSCATSATSTVLDTTVVTAVMTTGVAMIEMTTRGATATAIATTVTTIGGDEFHSLSNICWHPLVPCWFTPSEGLGYLPGPLSLCEWSKFGEYVILWNMPGTLYLVATPIGNLADITHRALQILKDVELIACEDTRHTRKLLQHYGITTKTVSYHEHNEQQRAAELIDLLQQGSDLAVVSDAGTPSISDPGFRLVRAAIENEIAVVPVPGPSALISALIAAGLPTDEFFFAGFLPAKSNARRG